MDLSVLRRAQLIFQLNLTLQLEQTKKYFSFCPFLCICCNSDFKMGLCLRSLLIKVSYSHNRGTVLVLHSNILLMTLELAIKWSKQVKTKKKLMNWHTQNNSASLLDFSIPSKKAKQIKNSTYTPINRALKENTTKVSPQLLYGFDNPIVTFDKSTANLV